MARRISRRTLIGGAAAIAAAPILQACVPSSTSTSTSGPSTAAPTAQPAPARDPDKPLVIAQVQGIPTLDPDKTAADVPRSVILAIYDALVDYDIDQKKIVPRLATSWQAVGDKTLELKLRPNVTFTNGEPFDARAVKFTLDRVKDPNTKSLTTTQFADVNGVDVVDPLTVRFQLKNAAPLLLQWLASWPILPPKYAAEAGDKLATSPIGTGPYKLKNWQQGFEVQLERNDSYWGPKPAFRFASYRTIGAAETQLASLLSGQIDIAADIDANQAKTLEGNKKVKVISKPRLLQALVLLDQAGRTDPKSPMTDKRVRQAINMAVNVDGIVKNILLGNGTRIAGGAHPGHFGFDPSVKPYPYDPQQAKQLLAAAGFANGFEARMISQSAGITAQAETAQAVQRDLAAVGIKVTLQTMTDPTAVGQLVRSGQAGPMIQFGNGSGGVWDAGAAYSFIFRTGNAFSYYSNKQFDDLYAQQASTLDQEKRAKILAQMQQLLREDAAALFEWAVHGIWGVSASVDWPAYPGRDDKLYTAKPA